MTGAAEAMTGDRQRKEKAMDWTESGIENETECDGNDEQKDK